MVFFKKKLRQVMLEKRNALLKEEISEKSAKIISALFSSPDFQGAKAILFYASFGNEVETHKAIEKAISLGKRACLPKVKKDAGLELYEIPSLSSLEPGVFGILEPVPEKSKPIQPAEIDLVVVPGVAFTEKGCRLGYGMGYYDNLLKLVRCPSVALAFELQVIPEISVGPHDVCVGSIITEKRTIGCK